MSNSTTTFSCKATETGKTVFYIKNEDGTRREVDSEAFAEFVDLTIKGDIRKLTTLRQRVSKLEQDNFTLRQMLHDLAYFSHIVDNTWNPEFEKGYNEAVSAMTASAVEYFTCQNLFADDFDRLDDLQIQLTAANERVRILREYVEAVVVFEHETPDCEHCNMASDIADREAFCLTHTEQLRGLYEQRREALEATKEGG